MLLLREQRVRGDCPICSLGWTRSDFSVGSDCLNAVKADPGRKMLENTLKAAPLACPARVAGQLYFARGSFSGKQKKHSPFTPNNAWTGYLQHKLPDKLQFFSSFLLFFKKMLTYRENSCNIIQVADRHGNETAQQALIGRPLMSSKSFEKTSKKFLTS